MRPLQVMLPVIVLCLMAAAFVSGAPQGGSSSPASKLFARLSSSIISVEAYAEGQNSPISVGSGIVFAEVIAVTNAHVLFNASAVVMRTETAKSAIAVVLYADPDRDIALLLVPPSLRTPIVSYRMVDKDPVVGTRVFAISNPLGLERSLTDGIISGLREFEDLGKVLQHTAAISPGSSGGGLFDESGALVGITSAQIVGGQNLNLAITASTIRTALQQFADKEDAKLSHAEYIRRTRQRFPEFGSLSAEELSEIMASRFGGVDGTPPSLRRKPVANPLEALVQRIDEIFSRYATEADRILGRLKAGGLSASDDAALLAENSRRIELLRTTNAPTQRSRDAIALLLSAFESVRRRLSSPAVATFLADELEIVLHELRQMHEAFQLLAQDAEVFAVSADGREFIDSHSRGLRSQIASTEAIRAGSLIDLQDTWIDSGGLSSLAMRMSPIRIAASSDGGYVFNAGNETLSTQDINYLVSGRLRANRQRFAGEITLGFLIRFQSERHACSSKGTLDVSLSADGRVLSGSAMLARQPSSVPTVYNILCDSLPSGVRTVQLTRQ